MADTIGPLRVLSTRKAAKNARHFGLCEVARDVLVGEISLGVLNRAGEAVDLGPARRRLALRRRLRASTLGGGLDEHCLCRAHLCAAQEAPRRGAGPRRRPQDRRAPCVARLRDAALA